MKTKVSHSFSELKSLLLEDASDAREASLPESTSCLSNSSAGKILTSDDDILHSYVSRVVKGSVIYEIMRDTEVEGLSFNALAEANEDVLCKDIIEFFACCFFEGDYSTLDTLVMNCESGYHVHPFANANILGHTVSMTYKTEFGLLAKLFTIALAIDKRISKDQEEIQFAYRRSVNSFRSTNPRQQGGNTNQAEVVVNNRIESADPQKTRSIASKLEQTSKKKLDNQNTTNTEGAEIKTQRSHLIAHAKQKTKSMLKPGGYWGSRGGVVSSPSMKRESFASHVASSGVWGMIAERGGHGHLIFINAGHGR